MERMVVLIPLDLLVINQLGDGLMLIISYRMKVSNSMFEYVKNIHFSPNFPILSFLRFFLFFFASCASKLIVYRLPRDQNIYENVRFYIAVTCSQVSDEKYFEFIQTLEKYQIIPRSFSLSSK